jgi:hypothetical protein
VLRRLQAPTKVLSIEERFKVIRELENKRNESDACRVFGLVNSTILGKTKPKLFMGLKETDREQRDFESLNDMKSVGRCGSR